MSEEIGGFRFIPCLFAGVFAPGRDAAKIQFRRRFRAFFRHLADMTYIAYSLSQCHFPAGAAPMIYPVSSCTRPWRGGRARRSEKTVREDNGRVERMCSSV